MSNDITVIITTGNPVTVQPAQNNVTIQQGQVLPILQQKEVYRVEKFTAEAGQTVFDLATTFRTNSCRVFLNGVLQEQDVDYTETNVRQQITFVNELSEGDKVECDYVVN